MRTAAARATALAMLLLPAFAKAQPAARIPAMDMPASEMSSMDDKLYTHLLLEQFEDRWNGRNHQFRYDGQAWIGTDYDKLWIKSEGTLNTHGRFGDGQHDLLYDRAISTYFDLQGGLRIDLDNGLTRTWAAFGIQGLAPQFFDLEATAYISDRGRLAARLKGSFDLLLTQRLILQPQAELNVYTKADGQRGTGSGLSDIDAGLRLRYEISRKFAPYIGVSYEGKFAQAARFARQEGEGAHSVRFAFGVRTWF